MPRPSTPRLLGKGRRAPAPGNAEDGAVPRRAAGLDFSLGKAASEAA